MADYDPSSTREPSHLKNRRHAAIMFTDIVGYTALMGSDEDLAFEMLRKNREIHNKLLSHFNGTLVKEIGDGMLISFHLSSEAVRCAIEIQKACKQENIPLKIGIHEGEVVIEGSDVLGDNVNIASRLAESTGRGDINVSESVYRNIRNKADINTVLLEEKQFKNVQELIKVYRILQRGEITPEQTFKSSKKGKIRLLGLILVVLAAAMLVWKLWPTYKLPMNSDSSDISIAVLPFVNMSNDAEQEYFSDGMTEEIIIQLAKISDLSVISRTSVFQYKNQQKDLKEIGKELGVSYILEGSVRKGNNQLRISTQLINAGTNRNIWSEIFDRELDNVLDIQIDVAKQVANALGITLTDPELKRIDRKSTSEYSAYDYYLKAVHEDKKWTPEASLKALEYLKKAIELDPEFSEAYSLYAWQYINLSASTTNVMSANEALKYALPAIKKAVALDSLSSDAFLVYGAVNFYLEWDFKAAKKNYEKSMDLNSWGEAPIYQCLCAYLEFLLAKGDLKTTSDLFDNIGRIDPSFFMTYDYESILQILNNEPLKAVEVFEKRLPFSNPDDWSLYTNYGSILYMAGQYEKAIEKLEKAISLRKKKEWYSLTYLAMALIHTEREAEAYDILAELIDKNINGGISLNSYIALIYNELGDEGKTLIYLENALQAHEPVLLWLQVIHFKNLLDKTAYQDILQKIGIQI